MSWSANFDGVKSAEGLDAEKATDMTPPVEELGLKAQRDFDNAREAAARILADGSLGEGPFRVIVSGHHDPHQDGPNDYIQVNVSRQVE